ncbi:hypothetical protein KC957_03780 [Candidatus Saccharibacteria bacterium]|nr:hypothetical protein [Candidatus Saccharibacteria bacterium]
MLEIATAAIADIFCPLRAEMEPLAISIACREAIIAAGGLSKLSGFLRGHQVYPVFAPYTSKLQSMFEQASEFGDISTRTDGSTLQAIQTLCDQAGSSYGSLSELCLAQEAWIGPIVYRNHWAGQDRIAGDLTVYCTDY